MPVRIGTNPLASRRFGQRQGGGDFGGNMAQQFVIGGKTEDQGANRVERGNIEKRAPTAVARPDRVENFGLNRIEPEPAEIAFSIGGGVVGASRAVETVELLARQEGNVAEGMKLVGLDDLLPILPPLLRGPVAARDPGFDIMGPGLPG